MEEDKVTMRQKISYFTLGFSSAALVAAITALVVQLLK